MNKKIVAALALYLMASSAFAGKVTGMVSAIKVKPDSKKVKFELTVDEKGASCGEGWFVINTNKVGGQLAFDIVLDAYKERRLITVKPDDTSPCGEESGAVTAKAITLGVEKSDKARISQLD